METLIQKGTGLLPLPVNPGKSKDFSKTVVFGATKAKDIPTTTIGNKPLKIKDQGDLDFCSGFGTSEVSEDQEGIELDPLWQFAQIKRVIGSVEGYGADLRSAGMSLVTYGSIPAAFAPYNIHSGERNFLANWENYDTALYEMAKIYKKKSMFFVDGPEDDFDNIRATLWENRAKKVTVLAGVIWRPSWTLANKGVVPPAGWENEKGGGHCIKIFDQIMINGTLYLKVQNSWGENYGDKGIFYFPREVVNREFAPYGQIFFSDMPVADAKYYNENGISVNDNWFSGILKGLWNFIKILFKTNGQ